MAMALLSCYDKMHILALTPPLQHMNWQHCQHSSKASAKPSESFRLH